MSNAGYKGQHRELPTQQVKVTKEYTATPSEGGPRSKGTSDLIVVIDLHMFSRECLARVLSSDCQAQVACYATIDEWLASGQAMPASLVVLSQCGCSQVDAIKEVEHLNEVSERISRCPAAILSDNEDPDLIVKMLGKNIRAYVPSSLPIAIAVQAIELARAGGVFVPASSLIAAHRTPEAAPTATQKANGMFTARQAAVVNALRRGKANKIIAYELKMRESTVKVHVRNIMKKLHATNRTEVAYIANQLFNGEEYVG